MSKIVVMVATHKSYRMPDDPVYLPVHVGAEGKADLGYVKDNSGDNISTKNPNYCELTGLYWVWKNVEADYVGLAHYRRHFAGKYDKDKWKRIASGQELAAVLQTTDVLLPHKRNYYIETTYDQYVHAHHATDLDTTRTILTEKYPEYVQAFDACMKRTDGHKFNMFIMKRDVADAYCEWLFSVLFEMERRLDISGYSPNDARVFGFVAERLLDVWIETNQIAYKEMPVVFMEEQNWLVKGGNFLKRKFKKQPVQNQKKGKSMSLSTVGLFKNLDVASEKLIHVEGKTLKQYQKILIKITEDIVSICEENQITYHLTGGSALGAVRHKGFIPWDDDMDIDVLGSDFERFVEAFQKKYGKRYWVHTYHTPGHGMLTNRIRLKNSICRAREDANNEECGFYVDFFRIENTYDNRILRNIHGFFCMGFGFLLSCRNFYKNRDLMMELSAGNAEVTRTFKLKINIGRLLSFMSVTKWAELTQWVYGLCKNNQSRYVTVPAGRKHYFGEMRLRENFVETADCDFEGHRWKVPKDYDGYLKSMYGDYMKIPPEEDREKHILLELKFPE